MTRNYVYNEKTFQKYRITDLSVKKSNIYVRNIYEENGKIFTLKHGYPQFYTQILFVKEKPDIFMKSVLNDIEGISKIDSADFKYARELGYTIRLIAMASISKNSVQQRVHPCFIKKSSDVAKVADETNAIIVQDRSIGKNIFQGPGAGSGPTGASVLSDLMDILRGTRNLPLGTAISKKRKAKIDNIEDLSFSYYLRIKAKDKPGVLAKISKALSSQKISIESIIQNPPVQTQNAEIILVLHKTKESMLLSALKKIRKIKDVGSSVKFIRIENSI